MKIIIAGGGISGVLSAYYLLEGGAKDVVLLESASEVASKASGANAAQLSYTYVNPIGQPSLFRSFLPILTGQKPGMQIKKWQPYLLLWGMRLLANSTTRAFERNRGKLLNLSLESRANMEALLEKTGITFQGFSRGKLQVYPDAEGFAEAAAFAQHLKETYGIEQALPGLAQTCELAGDIHLKADAFAGAVYSDIDLTADCKVFCQDLLAYLQKHYPGFTVHFDQKIASIEHKGHIKGIRTHNDTYEGDRYLLCTGAGTRALLGKPL
ncbi:MAG: FAD-dependent oxidoreductase, partial [Rickettsiales bacterium]